MAIFAVMHIFAFAWKPYSIKHSYANPLSEPGSGFSGSADGIRYKGGWLGIKALADAFNPWDIIKMTARGFRWMFVGYRRREGDVSYQDPGGKLGSDAGGYRGPTYAGTGEGATELRSKSVSGDDYSSRGRSDTVDTYAAGALDDRAGLLQNQGRPGQRMPSASPYRRPYGDESQIDLGGPMSQAPSMPGTAVSSYADDFGDSKHGAFAEQDDTAYRPGGASSSAAAGAGAGAGGLSGGVHPAFRREDPQQGMGFQGHDWDVFSGGQRGDVDEDEMGRPPTYRTRDPRR